MIRRVGMPKSVAACCWRHISSNPSTSHEENDFNKTITDGVAHVKSINVMTRGKSIVQLKEVQNCVKRKYRREFALPREAISGLREALLSCERSPPQIQNEADQLTELLMQRRFPASSLVVRKARNKVKEMLKSKQDDVVMEDLLKEKLTFGIDYKERNEVDKILKKAHFNWQPLSITSKEAAAAYALSRLAPNYAEMARVLDEFGGSDFVPESVLDYGSGVGAVFWAVNELYGSSVKEYCMVDPSPVLSQLAMDIMRVFFEMDHDGNLLHRNLNFRRHLVPSLQTKYDLVIAHRTLCEIGSQESRNEIMSSLWNRTKRFLVLVDAGTQDAYEALMEARDFLLLSGTQLHLQDTTNLLEEHNLMTDHIKGILHDKTISDLERFTIIRDLVPPELILPTALSPAKVYAPCPHDLGCPKLGSSSCTFPVRWRVIRADGRRSRYENAGTETGKFSYFILEKGLRPPHQTIARLLKIRHSSGHVTCDLCTAFKGIQRITVSRRAGILYQRTKSRRDGDIFPLEMKTVASEDMFDVCSDIGKYEIK